MSAITESARGEYCSIRIVGACKHIPETVVWCHANGSAAGKGVGWKSPDILGAYGCAACHDLYDRRRYKDDDGQVIPRADIELAFWQGHARSVLRLIEKGIVLTERGKVKVAA